MYQMFRLWVFLFLIVAVASWGEDHKQEKLDGPMSIPPDEANELCAFQPDQCPETGNSVEDDQTDNIVEDDPTVVQQTAETSTSVVQERTSKDVFEPVESSPPQELVPIVAQPSPTTPVITSPKIILTEIMFRDWSRTGGGGKPQWFELYNAGTGKGTLKGWVMVFETKKGTVSVPFDDISIEAQETWVVTNKLLLNRPWLRNIENVHAQKGLLNLKSKWVILDATGNEVYRRPFRWNWGIGGHTAEGYRQSVEIVKTVAPPEDFDNFYGTWTDISTVGYHVPVTTPNAPQLLQVGRIHKMGTWASLKE